MSEIDCILQVWIIWFSSWLCFAVFFLLIARYVHLRILRYQLTYQMGSIHSSLGHRKARLFATTIGEINRWNRKHQRQNQHLPQKRLRIVELCPGAGHNFGVYPQGTWLTIFEPDCRSVELTKRTLKVCPHVHLEELVTVGTSTNLPYLKSATYDAVVATFMLSSEVCISAVLSEAARIIRPGGYLLIIDRISSDHLRTRLHQLVQRPLSHLFYFYGCTLPRHVERLVDENQFHIDACETFDFDVVVTSGGRDSMPMIELALQRI